MANFVCPMHPEVVREKQGDCPKCGMSLVSSSTGQWRLAFLATAHCLTGCAIGEVLGMVIGAYFGIHDIASIILSIALAFVFGYSLTLIPLIREGLRVKHALSLAFASDTVSITSMEIMDNLIVILIPGALTAQLKDGLFWGSLAVSLVIAFLVTVPVNRYLISKGKGHAVKHAHN